MKWEHRHTFIVILILMLFSAWVVYKEPIKLGLDLKGGTHLVLECQDTKKIKVNDDAVRGVMTIIDMRINQYGVTEPVIQRKGARQIIVELPGVKDPDRAIKLIGDTALLEFKEAEFLTQEIPSTSEIKKKYGSEAELTYYEPEDKEKEAIPILLKRTVLTGGDLIDARPGLDQYQKLCVDLTFSKEGAKKFEEVTRRMVSEWTRKHGRPPLPDQGEGFPLAIVLDNKIISAPHVGMVIRGNRAQITGKFTQEEVKDLSIKLKAGALPVPVEVIENRTIGASLGKDTVERSIKAGIAGLILVLLFMLFYYRLPGLLADLSLGFYTILVFAIFKSIPVTLTLPGIAGFILSIGMAVDANILIFERLREELRSGKPLRAGIDAGFSRAFTSIFDANVTTLIACAVLYYFGAGLIRGFALTLSIGIIVSMFTAITVTRTLLHLIVNISFVNQAWLFGVKREEPYLVRKNFNIIGRRRIWFAISLLIILPGLVFLFPPSSFKHFPPETGLKKGIDFTGGTLIQIKFDKRIKVGELRKFMGKFKLADSLIQPITDKGKFYGMIIRTKNLSPNTERGLKKGLKKIGGEIEKFEAVGPTIGKEITLKATYAIIWASLLIMLYLSFRFSQIKYGICAIIALLHDTLVVCGIFVIMGMIKGVEIDSLFVTAILTIIGFSVNDTIVVFDRIRENLRLGRGGNSFEEIVNFSNLQTFARSINTSLTVVLVVSALLIFGGPVIKYFNLALLIGFISGTYSSIFNASPLLVVWERLMVSRAKKPTAQLRFKESTANQRLKGAKPLITPSSQKVEKEASLTQEEARKPSTTKSKKKKRKKPRRR